MSDTAKGQNREKCKGKGTSWRGSSTSRVGLENDDALSMVSNASRAEVTYLTAPNGFFVSIKS